jgi:superfamily II DNA or RNA helicase
MNESATVIGSTAAQGFQNAVLASSVLSPPLASPQAPADRVVPVKSELRPHQVQLIDDIDAALGAGCRRIMAQAATGAGKTMVAATIAKRGTSATLSWIRSRQIAWARSPTGRAM